MTKRGVICLKYRNNNNTVTNSQKDLLWLVHTTAEYNCCFQNENKSVLFMLIKKKQVYHENIWRQVYLLFHHIGKSSIDVYVIWNCILRRNFITIKPTIFMIFPDNNFIMISSPNLLMIKSPRARHGHSYNVSHTFTIFVFFVHPSSLVFWLLLSSELSECFKSK